MTRLPGFREALLPAVASTFCSSDTPASHSPSGRGGIRRRRMGFQLRRQGKRENVNGDQSAHREPDLPPELADREHVAAQGRDKRSTVRFARGGGETRGQCRGGKGVFTRQWEAQEQAMIVSLAGMGLSKSASKKMRVLQESGCKLDRKTIDAVETMEEGKHEWRSKWSPFRPVPSFHMNEERRVLIADHRQMAKKDKAARARMARQEAESKLRRQVGEDICEYDAHVMGLDMWQLTVRMPFKHPDYVRIINADRSFTLGELKQNLYELEGFHPTQQILYILEPEKPPSATTESASVQTQIPVHLYQKMHARATEPPPKMHKILLPRDGGEAETLTVLKVHSKTVFEMEVDKKVGKDLQRQMLMREIGIEGETFNSKTEEVFNKFDIDEGGTIEGDELGMTMKSLGIYLTEEEIDELIDKYDENGDCEFDLDEFRTMVRDIITGNVQEHEVIRTHVHVHDWQHSMHSHKTSILEKRDSLREVSFESSASEVRSPDEKSPETKSPGHISRRPSAAMSVHSAGNFSRTRSRSQTPRLSRASSAMQGEAAQLMQIATDDGFKRIPSASFLCLKAGSHSLQDLGIRDDACPGTQTDAEAAGMRKDAEGSKEH